MAPWIVARYDDGTWGTISDGSPIAWLDMDQKIDTKTQNFSGSLALDYEIIDGLKATVTGAYVNDQMHRRAFQKDYMYNATFPSQQSQLNERFG